MLKPVSRATHLHCPECDSVASREKVQTLCACGRPWFTAYDLDGLDGQAWRRSMGGRPWSLWRYAELLPLNRPSERVDLGEGATPVVERPPLAVAGGRARLLIKQEAGNPTGSFKDRGLSVAVNRSRELGVEGIELPSAGNAGIAAAAYAAAAGMRCRVAVPRPTPGRVIERCRAYGAEVIVSGETLIEAGTELAARAAGFLSVATMREPCRVEGKKTLGFELAEQLGWKAPDWIVFPTGGGTGIVAMHKAFDELLRLGLVDSRPRLVAVQSDACAPLVAAFEAGVEEAEPWVRPTTEAWGLKVPQAVGDRLTLRALVESKGMALAVPEDRIAPFAANLIRASGLVVGPEGAAAWLAVEQLAATGTVEDGQTVVAFQTGHPANYR